MVTCRTDSIVVMGFCLFTGTARDHPLALRGIGDLCIGLSHLLKQMVGVNDGFLFARHRRRVGFRSLAPWYLRPCHLFPPLPASIRVRVIPNAVPAHWNIL